MPARASPLAKLAASGLTMLVASACGGRAQAVDRATAGGAAAQGKGVWVPATEAPPPSMPSSRCEVLIEAAPGVPCGYATTGQTVFAECGDGRNGFGCSSAVGPCEPRGQVGAKCGGVYDCADGLYCDEAGAFVCASPTVPAGGHCTGDLGSCARDSYCDDT